MLVLNVCALGVSRHFDYVSLLPSTRVSEYPAERDYGKVKEKPIEVHGIGCTCFTLYWC